MIPSKRSWLALLIVAGLLLSSVAPVFAQDGDPVAPDGNLPNGRSFLYIPFARNAVATELEVPAEGIMAASGVEKARALPASVADLKLAERATLENGLAEAKLAPALRTAQGKVNVVVQLTGPALTQIVAASGLSASAADATAVVSAIAQQQAQVTSAAQGLDAGAQVLGSVHKALNAVMLQVDAAALKQLAANPNVRSINPVIDYQVDLAETVPYIGARRVQEELGFDGTGVKVAVVDSGVDYTHAHFGGAGTLEAYIAAYGASLDDPRNTTRDGLFPTDKVVEGWDFVGESWPNGPLAPDEDPIDEGGMGGAGGHGTHVGDIIGGLGGVAPGVSLYAVKVCSSVSTSCSGVALIQAMDYVVDPNGDNDLSDHMDVVNMSLGSNYGDAYNDDLSQAVQNNTAVGVLTVASAGNGSDKPFVAGTPANALSALSVAQTEVPSSKLDVMEILSPASVAGDYAALWQPWSGPLESAIEAPVQYGDGAGGNLLGCDPYAAGSLAGKVLFVNRGTCAISVKVGNGADAGAVAVVVALVAPGDPTLFSYGGGNAVVPGFNVSLATGNALRAGLAEGEVVVRFDPANAESLVMGMVGSSSRGPSMRDFIIKPEIGAPGGSVSAVSGSGTGVEPFSGTSGAAPMVSGAAALVKDAYPSRGPLEIKAVLVNTAETQIMNKAALLGGGLAPISRIGGGEVRVDRAVLATAAAWDAKTMQPAISLGFNDWSRTNILRRPGVTVRNYSNVGKTYKIDVSYRFADDQARNALTISAPKQVFVSANSVGSFGINFVLRSENLEDWNETGPNSGAQGANSDLLTRYEYDGYVTLTNVKDAADTIHLPWQILPRKAGEVALRWNGTGRYVEVKNNGVGTTRVESYSLIGKNGNLPEGGPGENNPVPDLRYFGYATYPVPAGYCSADESFVMAFAFNTWEPLSHSNAPAQLEVDIDVDQDGTFDYYVFTFDLSLSGNLTDGRNVTWVQDARTGAADAWFYTDHQFNSGNTVLTICGEQIGMNADNFFDPMDVSAYAADIFYQGAYTDAIEDMTISPLGEQYLGVFETGGVGGTRLAPLASDKLRIYDFGQTTNNTEMGLLLLYRDGAVPGVEAAALYASR